MRTTLYGDVTAERRTAAFSAAPLKDVEGASARKRQRSKRLVEPRGAAGGSHSLAVDILHQRPESRLYEQVVLMAACN